MLSVVPLLQFLGAVLAFAAAAAGCYLRSYRAQRGHDMHAFFLFHMCWHYAVAANSVLVLLHC